MTEKNQFWSQILLWVFSTTFLMINKRKSILQPVMSVRLYVKSSSNRKCELQKFRILGKSDRNLTFSSVCAQKVFKWNARMFYVLERKFLLLKVVVLKYFEQLRRRNLFSWQESPLPLYFLWEFSFSTTRNFCQRGCLVFFYSWNSCCW